MADIDTWVVKDLVLLSLTEHLLENLESPLLCGGLHSKDLVNLAHLILRNVFFLPVNTGWASWVCIAERIAFRLGRDRSKSAGS